MARRDSSEIGLTGLERQIEERIKHVSTESRCSSVCLLKKMDLLVCIYHIYEGKVLGRY